MEVEQRLVDEGPVRFEVEDGSGGSIRLALLRADGDETYIVADEPSDARRIRVADAETALAIRPFRGQLYLARSRDYTIFVGGSTAARVTRDRGASAAAKRKEIPQGFEG